MDGQVCPNRAENGEMVLLGGDVECFPSVIHRWGETYLVFPRFLPSSTHNERKRSV